MFSCFILRDTWFGRGGAVCWGIALQAGRSWVRFPVESLEFFSELILPVALWLWARLSLKQKRVQEILPGGKGRHRADKLTTFMCQLSRNFGASTSWNPKGLSRPVTGKLYRYRKVLQILTEFAYWNITFGFRPLKNTFGQTNKLTGLFLSPNILPAKGALFWN
jgi:hypothetical protein